MQVFNYIYNCINGFHCNISHPLTAPDSSHTFHHYFSSARCGTDDERVACSPLGFSDLSLLHKTALDFCFPLVSSLSEDYASMCNLGERRAYGHDALVAGPSHEYEVSPDDRQSAEQRAVLPFYQNVEREYWDLNI